MRRRSSSVDAGVDERERGRCRSRRPRRGRRSGRRPDRPRPRRSGARTASRSSSDATSSRASSRRRSTSRGRPRCQHGRRGRSASSSSTTTRSCAGASRDLLEAEDDLEVVGEAGTAEEAVGRILATSPDVCVLDVRLPDGTGVEVCRAVRERRPELACLMLTSFSDDEALLEAVLAGAAGYLLKQVRGSRPGRRRPAGRRRPVAARPGGDRDGAATAPGGLGRGRAARRPHRAGAQGAAPARRRAHEPPDRRRAVPRREDGEELRVEPAGQARHVRRTEAAVWAARLEERRRASVIRTDRVEGPGRAGTTAPCRCATLGRTIAAWPNPTAAPFLRRACMLGVLRHVRSAPPASWPLAVVAADDDDDGEVAPAAVRRPPRRPSRVELSEFAIDPDALTVGAERRHRR